MSLPPKEMYTFCEVADRWKVPVQTIEDYLLTDKLIASFFLKRMMLGKYTLVLDPEDSYSDDPYIYDMDYDDCHDDPDFYIFESGIFDLCYKHLEWDENGQTTLSRGFDLGIAWPHEEKGYYGLIDPFILKRENIFITLKELERFETEHSLQTEILSEQDKCILSSVGSVIKLHTTEMESCRNNDGLINPKRETTLLTVIAALLEVISGEFVNREVTKHPSIKNQSDLIDKLAELETRGLSKRNLQGIFSDAKEAKKRS